MVVVGGEVGEVLNTDIDGLTHFQKTKKPAGLRIGIPIRNTRGEIEQVIRLANAKDVKIIPIQ